MKLPTSDSSKQGCMNGGFRRGGTRDIDKQFFLLDSVSSGLSPRPHRTGELRLFMECREYEEFPDQNDKK